MSKLNKALQAVVAGMAGKVYLIDSIESRGLQRGWWSPIPLRKNQVCRRRFLGITPRKRGECFKYDMEWRVEPDAAYIRQECNCDAAPEDMTMLSSAPFDELRHSADFSEVALETSTGRITYRRQPT